MNTQTETVVVPSTPLPAQGSLLFTVGGMLALVLLLAVVVTWAARYFGFASPGVKQSHRLAVKASVTLGQRERVVLVEVDNTCLVLGVTAGGITPLTRYAKPETGDEEAVAAAVPDFSSTLKTLLKGRKPGAPS